MLPTDAAKVLSFNEAHEAVCYKYAQSEPRRAPATHDKRAGDIGSKEGTDNDRGSEYMVSESSLIDNDDETTDQKVLAGTSTQTDLSVVFDMPVTALLPVVSFILHGVSCHPDPRTPALPPPRLTVKGSIIKDTDRGHLGRLII
ncbi:hypothetical protein BU17DRAFT_64245 [Hysterangium stoloniferum]|nr:hypothetical protein BU17DRAFT_64245 [Hysterangium stoloniferum]